jgi:hypothetical protein
MKYRFGMPWYGWLLLFVLIVTVPPLLKSITAPTKQPENKKENLERKQ